MEQLDADKARARLSDLEAELRAVEAKIAQEIVLATFCDRPDYALLGTIPDKQLSESSRLPNRTAPPAVNCKIPQICLDHVTEFLEQSMPNENRADCGPRLF
jgi:hypothetical protein